MDRGGGDQGPIGSDSGAPPAPHDPETLAQAEKSDPNQTGGDPLTDPDSGAGYGNHAEQESAKPEGEQAE